MFKTKIKAPPVKNSVFGSLNIDPNSKTPYTDATQCRKSANHVKRPMNPFMVWSKIERRRLSEIFPNLHNAEISKSLGQKWKTFTEWDKFPYKEESDRLNILHAKEFPNYKYRPRKKKAKSIALVEMKKKTKTKKSEKKIASKTVPHARNSKTKFSRVVKKGGDVGLHITIDENSKNLIKSWQSNCTAASQNPALFSLILKNETQPSGGCVAISPTSSAASPGTPESADFVNWAKVSVQNQFPLQIHIPPHIELRPHNARFSNHDELLESTRLFLPQTTDGVKLRMQMVKAEPSDDLNNNNNNKNSNSNSNVEFDCCNPDNGLSTELNTLSDLDNIPDIFPFVSSFNIPESELIKLMMLDDDDFNDLPPTMPRPKSEPKLDSKSNIPSNQIFGSKSDSTLVRSLDRNVTHFQVLNSTDISGKNYPKKFLPTSDGRKIATPILKKKKVPTATLR